MEVGHQQSLQKKMINNDFWRFCRESELRTFGIYVAETIDALRPESFCA